MYALEAKNEDVALALLKRGAGNLDITAVDKVRSLAALLTRLLLLDQLWARLVLLIAQSGDTALHLAMANDMARVVRTIATQYTKTIDVNAQNAVWRVLGCMDTHTGDDLHFDFHVFRVRRN